MDGNIFHPIGGAFSGVIALETPRTTMPAVLPPLQPWSRDAHNRCDYDDVASLWTTYDAITFLVDLGVYRPVLHDRLTGDEKEQELRIKPVPARRRYVVSRAVLKLILSEILQKEDTADIVLARDASRRLIVLDEPQVFPSLSYYGTSIAITLGKQKIGSDIEGVRPVHDRKIVESPLFHLYPYPRGHERAQQVIHLWTLLESYAKLSDTNPYPLLNASAPFADADFVSYCIDRQMIFSLASADTRLTEILVWLDR